MFSIQIEIGEIEIKLKLNGFRLNLTIQSLYKGNSEKKTMKCNTKNIDWQENHLEQLRRNYKKAYILISIHIFENLYSNIKTNLLKLIFFLKEISRLLGINTKFIISRS